MAESESESNVTPSVLPLPTVRIFGKKGWVIVNLTDLEKWQANGYKTVEDLAMEKAESKAGLKPKV